MKSVLKRMIACATATVTLALGVGSLGASALTPSITPNFGLEYAVYTERISGTNNIKVTFHITNNPGICGLEVVFLCDEYCKPIDKVSKQDGFSGSIGTNPSYGGQSYYIGAYGNIDYSNYTGDLDIIITYEVKANAPTTHEFKVGVSGIAQYQGSDTPVGTIYSRNSEEFYNAAKDTLITVGNDKQAFVGDLNNDKIINSLDVNCLQRVISYASANKYTTQNPAQITLSELNNAICDYPDLWSDMPGLICADVANTDGNNVINNNDYRELLDYAAKIGASLPSSNAYIGKPVTVSIVM